MVLRNPQTRPSLGGLDQTKTKSDQTIPITAFNPASMTEKNIQGGFMGAGLVPHDPESVLSKLDVRIRTPTSTLPPSTSADPWIPKTPQNPLEANSQSELIKTRISNHQNSSPTSMINAVDQFAKGAEAIMHRVALLEVGFRF
ncbi:hypothetical protein BFJ67_g18169 [Fusarium oxysporum f. sp. cepae]|nr:hypothetical protein BFJ67_g18169 [Fusarium oxysporum f. sp. cepae]